jgi:hypothetical protein
VAIQNLDILVAYADDRATFGAAHARWLANFSVHFEPACILMPRPGEPTLLVGPESDQYARLVGQIADVLATLHASLPEAEWVDMENSLCDLRAQKSPAGSCRHRAGRSSTRSGQKTVAFSLTLARGMAFRTRTEMKA